MNDDDDNYGTDVSDEAFGAICVLMAGVGLVWLLFAFGQ